MVLVEAGRGGRPMVKVEAPLVIYRAPGEYTEEIYQIYYE
jgi:tRNA1Val (adenine37-N6)-methyltransferase